MPEIESMPEGRVEAIPEVTQSIEGVFREGARRLLQAALEAEIEQHVARYQQLKDEYGRQAVVRNGHAPSRTILTAAGSIQVSRPRVDERRAVGQAKHEPFSSALLPRFLRRTPTLEGAVATLYLKGISGNDFPRALEALLGEGAKGLSASVVSRLKQVWEQEYKRLRTQPLPSEEYVYVWADGVYFNVRLDDERCCVLVIVGANVRGEKELLGIRDGFRESEQSWTELLQELRDRGLTKAPQLAIGDGALGFWKALAKVFPSTRCQRCWVHKTANVLDKLPSSMQGRAKGMLHDIYRAESKASALKAYGLFQRSFQDKYPEAVSCLAKDEQALFSFYEFPAAHWQHIRSTNLIESVFATVRLRTAKTKGCGTRLATMGMVLLLIREAQRGWHKLYGAAQLSLVHKGKRFVDGVLEEKSVA